MKRLFILASAAALLLASCAKTTVVYNEAPEEIGFKAVTGVMTKAPIPTGNLPTTEGNMVVYASKSKEESANYADAFIACEFEYHSTGSYWGGTTPQYWPVSGYMKFMAYYPSGIGTASGAVSSGVTITGINIKDTQTDILYTDLTNAYTCATASASNVPLQFKHALSLIEVTAAVAGENMTNVRVTNVAIEKPVMQGTLKFNGSGVPTWENPSAMATNYPMDNDISSTDLTTTPQALGTGALVVPGDQTKLHVTYSVAGLDPVTAECDITGTWEVGKKYIYNIEVTLKEIKITATVDDWDGDVNDDDNVNEDDQTLVPVNA